MEQDEYVGRIAAIIKEIIENNETPNVPTKPMTQEEILDKMLGK